MNIRSYLSQISQKFKINLNDDVKEKIDYKKIIFKYLFPISEDDIKLPDDEKLLSVICEYLMFDRLPKSDIDCSVYYYIGGIYNVKKDYDQMKKYYMKAIEKIMLIAMYNLARYYKR